MKSPKLKKRIKNKEHKTVTDSTLTTTPPKQYVGLSVPCPPSPSSSSINNAQDSEDTGNEMEAESDHELQEATEEHTKKPISKEIKKKKRGIIYLSTIPKHMTVRILREMLNPYGDVGRIFLQPVKIPEDAEENKKKKKRRRWGRRFTEGWVEFESKRAAKGVAEKLNNTSMAIRKSSKFYDILWCIKYLPRFKWVHLSERLTYEKAVFRQRMQAEISQARREATFFQDNLEKSEMYRKKMKKNIKKSET